MINTFYYLVKIYTKLIFSVFILVVGITLSAYAENNYHTSINKNNSNLKPQNNLHSVSDSILSYEQAEELWGTIDFTTMQSEVANSLGLSIMESALFWQYLQPEIYQNQLAFLNGGYKTVTLLNFPQYTTNLEQSYITLYPDFLNNQAIFIQQVAQQNAANNTTQVNGPCTNMGFQSGTTSGWTTYSGTACGAANLLPCNLNVGANPRISITTTGTTDPYIPSLPTVAPGATYSLMLEDYLNGANASAISQTFLVTATNNVLTYKYAAVLEDPTGANHTRPQRPYFKVRLTTQSGVDISCGDYTAVVQPPIANFDSVTVNNIFFNSDAVKASKTLDLYYRTWTTVSIPLTKYIGQNVTIEFIASDCSLGGHRGYAYLWAECSAIPVLATNYICVGETLSYTAPPGFAAYDWIGPGIVSGGKTPTVQINQPGSYSLVLTPYSDNPCLDTVNFTVLPRCFPTPVSDTLCETTQGSGQVTGVNLNSFNNKVVAYNPIGIVQSWHTGLPASASNIVSAPTNVTVSNGSKYFALITYPSPSTEVDTAELDFVVNSLPIVTIPSFGPYCAGTAPVSLVGISPPGGTLTGKNVSSTGVFNPSVAGDDTIKYVYTNAQGCKDSATQIIEVNSPLVLVAPNDTTACQEAPISLSTLPIPNASFSWYDASGNLLSSTNVLNVAAGTTTATYFVKVIEGVCSSIDSGLVTGIPLPIVAVNDTSYCVGGTGTIKGHVSNSGAIAPYNPTYAWTMNDSLLLTGQLQLPVSSPGLYHLTVTDQGCTGSDSAQVTTNPLPVIPLPPEVKYCNDDSVNSVTLDAGSGGIRYVWQPVNDSTELISVSTPGTYTVYVTNVYNCSAQAQTLVRLVCPPRLFISSAFSPNDDGSNDIYDVYSAHVGTFHMLVFNRWGEIIFESTDKNIFWNGVYRSEHMPTGVYPWTITYEGDTEEYKGPYKKDGSVTIVK